LRCARPILALVLLLAALSGCGPDRPPLPPEESIVVPGTGSVTVYVEAPRSIAGPILKSFTEQSGVEVHPFYRENLGEDFFPRLAAGAAAGQVDVFWAVTPLAAMELARQDLAVPFRPLGARPVPEQYRDTEFHWIGFAVNPRVIIYNNTLVGRGEAPQSIDDLVRAPWGGKGALSRIRQGTSAFQAAALFALRGVERARGFYEEVARRHNLIAEDDAGVVEQVSSGKALWGLCDLDVAIAANREGGPLHITYPRLTPEAFVIPEVASLVRKAPHLDQAKGLIAYLLTTETAYQLGRNDRALITVLSGVPKPDCLPARSAFDVTRLDNQGVFEEYRRNAPFFTAWGAGAAGGAPAR